MPTKRPIDVTEVAIDPTDFLPAAEDPAVEVEIAVDDDIEATVDETSPGFGITFEEGSAGRVYPYSATAAVDDASATHHSAMRVREATRWLAIPIVQTIEVEA